MTDIRGKGRNCGKYLLTWCICECQDMPPANNSLGVYFKWMGRACPWACRFLLDQFDAGQPAWRLLRQQRVCAHCAPGPDIDTFFPWDLLAASVRDLERPKVCDTPSFPPPPTFSRKAAKLSFHQPRWIGRRPAHSRQ